jgi:hypothetical protein
MDYVEFLATKMQAIPSVAEEMAQCPEWDLFPWQIECVRRCLSRGRAGVIERCIKLWSAPGDLILSPFAGVGSEGVVAVQLNRRFVGIELKRSYWETACKNIADAARQTNRQLSLFEV